MLSWLLNLDFAGGVGAAVGGGGGGLGGPKEGARKRPRHKFVVVLEEDAELIAEAELQELDDDMIILMLLEA